MRDRRNGRVKSECVCAIFICVHLFNRFWFIWKMCANIGNYLVYEFIEMLFASMMLLIRMLLLLPLFILYTMDMVDNDTRNELEAF